MLTRLVALLMWVVHCLPFRSLAPLAWVLGGMMYRLARERRRVGEINLALCFPAWDEPTRTRLLKAHFREMAHVLLEYGYCWFASADRMRRLVRLEGLEHFEALGGRPAILMIGHMTGLELAGIRLSADVPVVTMFTRQKHRGLDAFIERKRLRFNTGIMMSRQEGIRPAIRAMKRGYRLYYLPDQDVGLKESVFVPFFGVPAATISGMSRLARLADAVVLPLTLVREPGAYCLRIEPPLSGYPTEDELADALRMNRELEARIRSHPAQYFWLHKRFKTRPEGEAGIY